MLEEQIGSLAGLDREVLLDLRALLAAERWIGEHDIVAILLLYIADVLRERVGVNNVRRLDAMQDHVHDPKDVGEALLLLAVKRSVLKLSASTSSSASRSE